MGAHDAGELRPLARGRRCSDPGRAGPRRPRGRRPGHDADGPAGRPAAGLLAVGASTILGINARYATFQENGFSFRALYFASGTRFYVLEVGASSPSGEGLERFRDSFRLTDTPY